MNYIIENWLVLPTFLFFCESNILGRSPSPEDNDGTCLHISGLAMRTKERDLEDLCLDYGKVESIKLVIDPRTGTNSFSDLKFY